MTLQSPRLDDRAYADIVAEAKRRIRLYCPEWTDHTPSDPGITLIELFAWMTDIILYRFNRVPEKHYIKLMELLGISLHAAEPAQVPVTVWLTAPQPVNITIPAGTQFATTRTEQEAAIVFSTDHDFEVRIPEVTVVMTSTRHQEGKRSYTPHDVKRLAQGYESCALFSEPPQSDDALYIGFANDMSHHLLSLELDVDVAGGAGIDPTQPPYVWEVIGPAATSSWLPVDTDSDSTRGFNEPGIIKLHLPEMQQANRHHHTAYWLRCRLAPDNDTKTYKKSPRLRQLTVSSWGGTIPSTHSTIVQGEIVGRSDGSPGQRFFLSHQPLLARAAPEHLLVRLPGGRLEQWTEVADFADSGPDDRHYTLDSQSGELRLGPALPQRDGSVRCYGAIPPREAILLMNRYRHGGGQLGNVKAGAISVLKSGLPYVDQVRNRQPARGGLDPEALDDAKLRVPGHLRSLQRAVTAKDFAYLATLAAPGQVSRAHCLQPPATQAGEIKVLVIPRVAEAAGFIPPDALVLDSAIQEAIHAYLDERRLLSTRLTVTTPAYQWVATRVRLYPSTFADAEAVQRRVTQQLWAFLNPLVGGPAGTGWDFGRDLFASDVMAMLLAVPGVEFVRAVELFPVTHSRGQFQRGEATQTIQVVTHGVVASYAHEIIVE